MYFIMKTQRQYCFDSTATTFFFYLDSLSVTDNSLDSKGMERTIFLPLYPSTNSRPLRHLLQDFEITFNP